MGFEDYIAQPFVLPLEPRDAVRDGRSDVYLPDAAEPRPAVVLVHGGPLPAELSPTPREWPVFRGYGALTAARGSVGVVVEHGLHSPADYPKAADDVAAAVESARAHPGVDGSRVALWFFSGGGPLLADWLRTPPEWLRCLAASYPVAVPPPEWQVDPRFDPIGALGAGSPPIVLTRAGREDPSIAAGVESFVDAARRTARLEVVDVPNGQHSFDTLDHTEESRQAVERALETVRGFL
ncbi:alpha/beta hydrolase [Saccharopolyspora griseoalba]|uniref:Alpha/beta hydrolase n=1 Tax=Saccharopolyspora griseoalba TaxID=1431848 RepID=A0ABW2LKK2_9PSEU